MGNTYCLQGSNTYYGYPHLTAEICGSLDQTTRVHAPLLPSTNWHEIGRPQIHGYDLVDVAHVGNFCFASIAEEKVIRVFEASQPFVKVMKQLCAFEGVDEVEPISLIHCEIRDSNR
jgi:hypothetical protein